MDMDYVHVHVRGTHINMNIKKDMDSDTDTDMDYAHVRVPVAIHVTWAQIIGNVGKNGHLYKYTYIFHSVSCVFRCIVYIVCMF
jgi:hypothetical protein